MLIIYFLTTIKERLYERKDSPFLARNQRMKKVGEDKEEHHSLVG